MNAEPAQAVRRMLVVDDNRLILTMVRDFFEPHGYDVEALEDPRQALGRLEQGASPDVIVADILMPEMDGWQFYEEVRKRPGTAQTPFVFLSTETDLPQRLRGLRLGADDYVTKPFAVEELHARIEKILHGHQEQRAEWGPAGLLLAGDVAHLSISDLLQILSLNGKDALIQLRRNGTGGEIVFENGELVHAEAGAAAGKKALYRMLGWLDARFRVLPRNAPVARRTLNLRAADAVMDGLVSLDEWERYSDTLPDPRMRLELCDDARSRLKSGEVSPAEFDVMARSKQGLSIGQVIEESPLPDGELARAICGLVQRGVVRPVAI
jgi:DNA-binding response OmpR family regulator